MDRIKCAVCGEEMGMTMCAYWSDVIGGPSMHIWCGEKTKELFKITYDDYGVYYEDNIDNIGDIIKEIEVGEAYIIEKVQMSYMKFLNLKEFEGF